jgi:hypothetical protein
MKDDNQ